MRIKITKSKNEFTTDNTNVAVSFIIDYKDKKNCLINNKGMNISFVHQFLAFFLHILELRNHYYKLRGTL